MTAAIPAVLTALGDRARAALAANDPTAACALLHELLALDIEASAPMTQALGRAMGALAGELIELPDPAGLEALFNRALKVFEGATDATIGDLLTTWNNLAALYHRHGVTDRRDHVNHNIVGVAERFDGPLDSASTMVFMSVGDMYRKNRQFAPMLTLYRQVQRAMLSDTQMLDSTRALWLQRFASGLVEAGQDEAVEAALELAIVALDARSHAQPLSIGACHLLLAWRHEHQGGWRAAAQRIERVLTLPGLPAAELTEALSRAGRAWFKAGEFDAASRCCARAVRRRAGLESAQAQDASS